MKARLFSSLLLPSLMSLSLYAEDLTAADKEALLSRIDSLEEKVVNANNKSQQSAISVFKSAMNSESATFKLYLDCLEKIELEDKKKKGEDVRDKIRKLRETTSSEFKCALRHQLFWLVYSMEAARNPDFRQNSAQKLVECMSNILEDTNKLDAKNTIGGGVLKQNPYGSVFAKVYKVNHLKPKDWPSGPMDFDGLFKGLIVKKLIEKGDYAGARKQWGVRLNAERSLIEAFAADPDSTKYGDNSVALDNYLEKRVPALRWQNEMALFKAGDRRTAALALYDLLEKYPEHSQYLNWVKEFKAALAEEEEEEQEQERERD